MDGHSVVLVLVTVIKIYHTELSVVKTHNIKRVDFVNKCNVCMGCEVRISCYLTHWHI
jgi:hypothetical protein